MEKSKLQNKSSSIDSSSRVFITEKLNLNPSRLAKRGKILALKLRDDMKNCEVFINVGQWQIGMTKLRKLWFTLRILKGNFHNEIWHMPNMWSMRLLLRPCGHQMEWNGRREPTHWPRGHRSADEGNPEPRLWADCSTVQEGRWHPSVRGAASQGS